jgi:pyridoxal/pyridoxine/pyridoxamine kinase
MAAKKKAEANLITPNAEEAQVYVDTLKAAMTVFDATKLSDDHTRAILVSSLVLVFNNSFLFFGVCILVSLTVLPFQRCPCSEIPSLNGPEFV